MTDASNGYERVAAVLDLGCGSGLPTTRVLVDEGLDVHALDAAPSMVAAFRRNLPQVPVACESAVESPFFARPFDGIVAWGLMFLLAPEEQRRLIERIGYALVAGGRLLFTSEARAVKWTDVMTGLESRSLGAQEYRGLLADVGVVVTREYDDEGENHYYDCVKNGTRSASPAP